MNGKASATIERYLVLHQMISKDHGLPGNRIAVSPEAVKRLPALLNNSLSFNAAQAYLDVSHPVRRLLGVRNKPTGAPRRSVSTCPGPDVAYHRDQPKPVPSVR
jgi:hypothetical protein